MSAIVPQSIAGTARSQTEFLRFDHITTAQGLSQDIVSAIVQDREGFMWFATEDGLNRYDGYSIKVYKNIPGDTSSVSGNASVLYADRWGTLWACVGRILNEYHPEDDAFIRHSFNARLSSLCDDPRGNLWIGADHGLKSLDIHTGAVTSFIHDASDTTSLSDDNVLGLTRGASGALWVGTMNGFNKLNTETGKFIRYSFQSASVSPKKPTAVASLLEDSDGYLWYGIGDNGLGRLDLKDLHRYGRCWWLSKKHPPPRAILQCEA